MRISLPIAHRIFIVSIISSPCLEENCDFIKYARNLLENIGTSGCKPAEVPLDPNVKLIEHDGKLLKMWEDIRGW